MFVLTGFCDDICQYSVCLSNKNISLSIAEPTTVVILNICLGGRRSGDQQRRDPDQVYSGQHGNCTGTVNLFTFLYRISFFKTEGCVIFCTSRLAKVLKFTISHNLFLDEKDNEFAPLIDQKNRYRMTSVVYTN